MNEKELGEALLGQTPAPPSAPADTRALTRRILARDRGRVRLLTGLIVVLWAVSAALIFALLYRFLTLFPKHEHAILTADHSQLSPAELRHMQQMQFLVVGKVIRIVVFSVASLTLAALGTVALVFVSRSATLRQVNASLAEIAEQLRQLRSPP